MERKRKARSQTPDVVPNSFHCSTAQETTDRPYISRGSRFMNQHVARNALAQNGVQGTTETSYMMDSAPRWTLGSDVGMSPPVQSGFNFTANTPNNVLPRTPNTVHETTHIPYLPQTWRVDDLPPGARAFLRLDSGAQAITMTGAEYNELMRCCDGTGQGFRQLNANQPGGCNTGGGISTASARLPPSDAEDSGFEEDNWPNTGCSDYFSDSDSDDRVLYRNKKRFKANSYRKTESSSCKRSTSAGKSKDRKRTRSRESRKPRKTKAGKKKEEDTDVGKNSRLAANLVPDQDFPRARRRAAAEKEVQNSKEAEEKKKRLQELNSSKSRRISSRPRKEGPPNKPCGRNNKDDIGIKIRVIMIKSDVPKRGILKKRRGKYPNPKDLNCSRKKKIRFSSKVWAKYYKCDLRKSRKYDGDWPPKNEYHFNYRDVRENPKFRRSQSAPAGGAATRSKSKKKGRRCKSKSSSRGRRGRSR